MTNLKNIGKHIHINHKSNMYLGIQSFNFNLQASYFTSTACESIDPFSAESFFNLK